MIVKNSYYLLEYNEINNLNINNALNNLVLLDNGYYVFSNLYEYDYKLIKINDDAFYGDIDDYLTKTKKTFDYIKNKIVDNLDIEVRLQDNYYYSNRLPYVNNYCTINKQYIQSVVGKFDTNSQFFKGQIGFKVER